MLVSMWLQNVARELQKVEMAVSIAEALRLRPVAVGTFALLRSRFEMLSGNAYFINKFVNLSLVAPSACSSVDRASVS